jgi:hypothetical protein
MSNIERIDMHPVFGGIPQHPELALLYSPESQSSYIAIIEFQNIEMKHYCVVQKTTPEGLSIIKSEPINSSV